MKMIYRKLPKQRHYLSPVTGVQFFRFCHSHLPDDEAKRQYSVKCQVGQVHSAKATVNARFPFLDGISKATDNNNGID
jgi:hypothetical protein